jgi:hypothetical protein
VWKDSEKKDLTLVNHFHGFSFSADDVLKITHLDCRHERIRLFQEDFVV